MLGKTSNPLDPSTILNDRKFAEYMLSKELDWADVVLSLRNLLRLKYFPVAIKFSFEDISERFLKYKTAGKNFTFCQYAAFTRQEGVKLIGFRSTMGCTNAMYVLGWKDFDEEEIRGHRKYARDDEQAEFFAKTKPRLKEGLKFFAFSPLHETDFEPDVVYIVCDVLQAYHICNDYMSAFNVHPLRPNFTVNSAVCAGAVWCYNTGELNLTPMCSGSKTSGKTEQGEVNIFIPGDRVKPFVERMLERTLEYGGVSFPRTGKTYPGCDVCKLCPIFKPKDLAGIRELKELETSEPH